MRVARRASHGAHINERFSFCSSCATRRRVAEMLRDSPARRGPESSLIWWRFPAVSVPAPRLPSPRRERLPRHAVPRVSPQDWRAGYRALFARHTLDCTKLPEFIAGVRLGYTLPGRICLCCLTPFHARLLGSGALAYRRRHETLTRCAPHTPSHLSNNGSRDSSNSPQDARLPPARMTSRRLSCPCPPPLLAGSRTTPRRRLTHTWLDHPSGVLILRWARVRLAGPRLPPAPRPIG